VSTGNVPPDPEQLIAEALRAQAARAPVVPTGALPAHQPAGSGEDTVAHPVRPESTRQESARQEARKEPVRQESAGDPSTSGYGLLSGMDSGLALLAGDSLRFTDTTTVGRATGPAGVGTRGTTRLGPPRIGFGAVLLLAVLLGFAAGAVVGLVTLL
jgi:hypothetical protein